MTGYERYFKGNSQVVRRIAVTSLLPLAMALGAGSALAQTDSTGSSSKGISNYGDITASSTWNRVSGKPATATRWPT